MKIGMTLPVMEPGLTRSILHDWCKQIDEGPYSSLALGERIAFANPEFITTLAAAAAWTRRVELIATVVVIPMHNPVWLAKQLATVDVLSEGRLTVGVGIGGREEDYLAVGADWQHRRIKEMESRVAILRRVWSGEQLVEGVNRSIGPKPFQDGGPSFLAGSIGSKSIASAASWADGLSGFSFNADVEEMKTHCQWARDAWLAQNRDSGPRLITSFWYAVGEQADAQLKKHLRHYLNWFPQDLTEAMIPSAGFAGTAQQFKDLLKQVEDTGCDELILAPTTADEDEVNRIADLIA